MRNYGTVSIITPSWNCGEFLIDTIKSIQAQTYTDWELLFQDDCSTDNTHELIDRFSASDTRIRYECNPQNSGAAITRNNALRRARGRWIAFLDSDDLWSPDKLEKQLTFMVKNGYYFSYTNYSEIDSESQETRKIVTGPNRISKFGMYCFCWPGCLTVMYDREKIGLIQITDIKKNNDYAMWLKVCHYADCYLLNENLAKYRRGRAGSISTHGYMTLIKWHYELFRKSEQKNPVVSCVLTVINLLCGLLKKMFYVKKFIE